MAAPPIQNASSTPLNQQTSTLPDMSDALLNWYIPMVFGIVEKSVVNFQVTETQTEIAFRGVIQPFSSRDLMLLPIGQRAWSHYWLHAEPNLPLRVDSTVNYDGKQYRVMALKNYDKYQYREYHLVTDWTGSGPTPVVEQTP